MLTNPVTDTVKTRTSWRTYLDEPLDEETYNNLKAVLEASKKGPFGTATRFELIDTKTVSGKQSLGTYGFISGARYFIVGAAKNGLMSIEDYGYQLERIILYATEQGLGTCWLGGFNRKGFTQTINPQLDETMPAITPIGRVPEKRRTIEKMIRWGTGARNRKPWSELFFKGDFTPLDVEEAGIYAEALENVRLGPSASNGQPWRLIVEDDQVHFYYKPSPRYQEMNRLDMGIAICHFDLTVKEQGIEGDWVQQETIESPPAELNYTATWRRL